MIIDTSVLIAMLEQEPEGSVSHVLSLTPQNARCQRQISLKRESSCKRGAAMRAPEISICYSHK